MGATVCDAVAADTEVDLVAAVDPAHHGVEVGSITIDGSNEAMMAADVDVAVDFTHLEAARGNILWLAEQGIHAVVGTTGFTEADLVDFEAAFAGSNCVIAPNFAIGAVLMMRFAEMAAPYFESAEIVELHHDQKVDAPSGTAMMTAERMAVASEAWAPDPTSNVVLDGARGGRGPAGIRVHSVRLRGLVAHQEVLLGTTGQSLSVRHDSYDRSSFMPGVLLAVKQVGEAPGLTLGLDGLLGL